MRDGAVLLAEHHVPATDHPLGTVLVRTPYGRRSALDALGSRVLAVRGYHVLVQSVRGTFGSGGVFDPMVNEERDGHDTVAWLREQPWFDGRLATYGASYLGWTQWTLMADPPPELRAAVVLVAPHDFAASVYSSGAFAFQGFLAWSDLILHQETTGLLATIVRGATAKRRLAVGAQRASARRRRRHAVRRPGALVPAVARAPRPRRPVLGRQAGHGGAGPLDGADAARRRLAGPVPRADGRAVPGARRSRRGRRVDRRPVDAPRHRHAWRRDGRPGDAGVARRAPRGRHRPHAPGAGAGGPHGRRALVGAAGVAAAHHPPTVAAGNGRPTRGRSGRRRGLPRGRRRDGRRRPGRAHHGRRGRRCDGPLRSGRAGRRSVAAAQTVAPARRASSPSSGTTRPTPPRRWAGACSRRTRASATTGGWPPAPTWSRSPHRRSNGSWSSRARPVSRWTTSPTRRTPTSSSGSATSPRTVGRTTSRTGCAGASPPTGPVTVELDPCFHRVAPGHRLALLVAGGAHPRFLRNNGTGEPPADAVGLVPVIHRIEGGTLTLPLTDDHKLFPRAG